MELFLFIVVTFILSYGIGHLFHLIRLPKLLGYLFVGLIVGNFFSYDNLISTSTINLITGFALSVILLKAGLGIEKAIIKKIGLRVLLLGTIPNILEGLVLAGLSILFFDFALIEAFMFGFIISAVSPAVVIPSMTKLMDQGYDKEVTTLNLAATSFDDVVSLTIFGVCLSLFLGTGNGTILILMAPIKIVIGGVVGAVIGFSLGRIMKQTFCIRYQVIQFLTVLAIAIVLKEYGHYILIIEMIAIMSLGYFLNDTNKEVGSQIKMYTNTVWKYAQVLLFFMIGFLADLTVIGEYLWIGLLVITLGLLARLVGVIISLHKSHFDSKQKTFSAIGNIPKATVQAVLGAVPLTVGVLNGNAILSLSALAIIFTAPIGLILIEVFSKKLLKKD